jgi:hypothetical protein
MATVPLFLVAHSRAGDKGNSQTMSLIPYRREDYDLLAAQVTPAAVRKFFGASVQGDVRRYDLPKLAAFNFVLGEALQGGVNDSLALDTHGKSRSSLFLSLMIEVPDDHPALDRIGDIR